MFQTFENSASPQHGAARLNALRAAMAAQGLAGFIVPRADAHQGEYVADCDARLAWLTGFTGSAGFGVILPQIAGVFIDGRYRTQVKAQVDLRVFTPVPWPEIQAGAWIAQNLDQGVIGFDPWLHSRDEIARITAALAGSQVTLRPCANLVDQIWADQRPAPPLGAVFLQPDDLAGENAATKRARLGQALARLGAKESVLTLPDSICWLLNIRGADVPRNPVVQAFARLGADGTVLLYADGRKFDAEVLSAMGPQVQLRAPDQFLTDLAQAAGPVLLDPAVTPLAVIQALEAAGVALIWGDDPCRLPKACKNDAEIDATRAAHLRDGAAVVEFMHWLSTRAPEALTEIAVVEALEDFRAKTNRLHDISFDTICGAGPNGAIIHYRVTKETDRPLRQGELLLVDSGAQYQDGTTDITRTFALGPSADPDAATAYTAVLRGLIAISCARWPRGVAGRDLDALARQYLWQLGYDYDHGTGHGVGAFLSVHEGPQRLSRVSEVALAPGMILSNEPGYYREGAFGIRLENLIVVIPAPDLGDRRDQLAFETLTFAPFDKALIDRAALSQAERAWLDAYHAEVLAKIGPRVSALAREWLRAACAPL